MGLIGPGIGKLGPQLVASFGEVIEPEWKWRLAKGNTLLKAGFEVL